MSRTNIPLESEVVTWLLRLIGGEELVEVIQGQERIEQVTGGVNQDYFIPSFGIDYISRRASAEAAKHVLDRLGLLDVISVNSMRTVNTPCIFSGLSIKHCLGACVAVCR